jgi:hypothetical protein
VQKELTRDSTFQTFFMTSITNLWVRLDLPDTTSLEALLESEIDGKTVAQDIFENYLSHYSNPDYFRVRHL